MWKLAIGFAVFAAVVLYVLSQSGANVDMSGEKHGAEAVGAHPPASAASR